MSIIISTGPYSGQSYVKAPRELSSWLKKFPGCLWKPDADYRWSVPDELISPMTDAAAAMGMRDEIIDHRYAYSAPSDIRQDLFPWQSDGVLKALKARALLLNFDTGLGKSATALEVVRLSGGSAIITCPASVRTNWEMECLKWIPHTKVLVIWPGMDPNVMKDDPWNILVISYEWLRENVDLLDSIFSIDTLIFDELHYVKNGRKSRGEKISRGEAAVKLSQCFSHAIKLGLTATSIANGVEDIWNQLNVLSPGRFSSWYRFVKDYCITSEGEYGGLIIEGLNPEREDELRWRIDQQSVRKTKAEVAHLLPPAIVSIDWHREKDMGACNDVSHKGLESHTNRVAPTKVKLTAEKILTTIREAPHGAPLRIAIITHLISTAENISAILNTALREDGEDDIVTCITGNVPAKKRDMAITRACQMPRSIVVATMHSMGVGRDELKVFQDVTFAELYWSPLVVIQTLGRFCRIGSPDGNVNVKLLALRGTVDEAIALTLEKKINAALRLNGVGADGELLRNGMAGDDQDDAAFMELVREQLSALGGVDEYGVMT